MKEITQKELLEYVDKVEGAFRAVVRHVIEEISHEGYMSHSRLKRLKKKVAVKFLSITSKEEQKK